MDKRSPLMFAHTGDLHLTKAKEQNCIRWCFCLKTASLVRGLAQIEMANLLN